MNAHLELKKPDFLVKLPLTELAALSCIYLLAKNNESEALAGFLAWGNLPLNTQFCDELNTALHIAAKTGSDTAVSLLLKQKNKFNIDLRNANGETALALARKNKHSAIEQLLLAAGAKDNAVGKDIYEKEDTLRHLRDLIINRQSLQIDSASLASCIYMLSCGNAVKTLKEIREYTINDDYEKNLMAPLTYGYTSLHIAAQTGASNVIDLLLSAEYKNHIDINRVTTKGDTALHIAVMHGKVQVVQQLIEKGAKINIARHTDGHLPIHIAAGAGHIDCMKILIESKANLNQRNYANSYTPAILAVLNDKPKMVEYLLQENADFKKISEDTGWNPLHWAAKYNCVECVKVMLKFPEKLDLNAQGSDTWSYTASSIAAELNHLEILKELHLAGADIVKPCPVNGMTPLHRTAHFGSLQTAEYLVANYKKKLTKDEHKHSAFYYACMAQNWDIAKIIYHSVRKSQLSKQDRASLVVFEEELELPKRVKLSKKNIFTKNPVSMQSNKNEDKAQPHNTLSKRY